VVPSDILQFALEHTWSMQQHDKDMVVMVHEINYKHGRSNKVLQSSLVILGKDPEHTAMSMTVGLPVAIVTRMILNGDIERRGVLMPKYPEIYNPILAELKEYGIEFKETVS
jgi:saccharopine dehydrogenase-like NADP-dependent oxidoreductase